LFAEYSGFSAEFGSSPQYPCTYSFRTSCGDDRSVSSAEFRIDWSKDQSDFADESGFITVAALIPVG
jgi:hypothetical protein